MHETLEFCSDAMTGVARRPPITRSATDTHEMRFCIAMCEIAHTAKGRAPPKLRQPQRGAFAMQNLAMWPRTLTMTTAISLAVIGITVSPLPAQADWWSRNVAPLGHAIEKGAHDTGNAIEKGAHDTGNAVEKGAHDTGNAV